MKNNVGSVWTDERIEQLKTLYESGISSSQIAGELSCGITRNAVIGKVHRLGLTRFVQHYVQGGRTPEEREAVIKRNNERRRHSRAAVRLERPAKPQRPIYIPQCAEVVSRGLTLLDLGEDDCRWPHGDGPYTFCGAPKAWGSYCIAHSALAVRHTAPLSPRMHMEAA